MHSQTPGSSPTGAVVRSIIYQDITGPAMLVFVCAMRSKKYRYIGETFLGPKYFVIKDPGHVIIVGHGSEKP
jgi:hypothetical protein